MYIVSVFKACQKMNLACLFFFHTTYLGRAIQWEDNKQSAFCSVRDYLNQSWMRSLTAFDSFNNSMNLIAECLW